MAAGLATASLVKGELVVPLLHVGLVALLKVTGQDDVPGRKGGEGGGAVVRVRCRPRASRERMQGGSQMQAPRFQGENAGRQAPRFQGENAGRQAPRFQGENEGRQAGRARVHAWLGGRVDILAYWPTGIMACWHIIYYILYTVRY